MEINLMDLMAKVETSEVKISLNAHLEKGVILGYMTGRKIENTLLVIGKDAYIRTGSIIYCGSKIGNNFQTGHNVIIREQNAIGDKVSVWSNSIIDYGCKIGNNVRIHSNVYIAQYTEIGEDSFLAPGVTIANDPHPICAECMRGPTIGARVKIGVNCTFLPKITIGDDSLIGAGTVVTKDIPANSVVVGNPGRIIGKASELKCKYGDKALAYPYLSKGE